MAKYALLRRDQLKNFIYWLDYNGYERLMTPNSTWEVLRWQGLPRAAMPIVFDNKKGEYLIVNKAAATVVENFISDLNAGYHRAVMEDQQ